MLIKVILGISGLLLLVLGIATLVNSDSMLAQVPDLAPAQKLCGSGYCQPASSSGSGNDGCCQTAAPATLAVPNCCGEIIYDEE